MGRNRNRRGKNRGRSIDGILVLDKPKGLSSNAALQIVKRLFNANKAGHTGSLDPLATGVLPLCFGEATKLSQFLLDSDKRYRVAIRLGERTDTGDADGEVIARADGMAISQEAFERALETFVGPINQVPPMYSAIKRQGVPLYKLAREGKEVERESREVMVYSAKVVEFTPALVVVDVHCSKGTYVRTLADDMGQMLGCGAHVAELRRTQAGVFDVADCVTLATLEETLNSSETDDFEGIDGYLFAMDKAVCNLPEVSLPEVTAGFIRQGQPVLVRHLPEEGLVRLYEEDRFIGIGSILDDGRVAPRRMIVDQQ